MAAAGYQVISPTEIYLGRTYGDWVSEFISWLFSIDPDKHNYGPVVFLKPFPSSPDPDYPSRIEPNLMVGNEKLQIFTDQAILIPVLLSYWASADPTETETMLRERVRIDMINGDYPPRKDQITIDGNPIQVVQQDISEYLIESPLFTLMVPDTEYGKSLKDYVDYPLMSGVNQSVGTGYFFLVKFLEEGSHIIHSYARGRTTEKGEYNEEFLYQIEVTDAMKRPHPPQRGVLPLTATNILQRKLKERFDKGELNNEEYKKLTDILNDSRQKNENAILATNFVFEKLKKEKPERKIGKKESKENLVRSKKTR